MVIQITPRSLVFILFKRKWAFFGFFAASILLTGAYFGLMGWKFKSEALVYMNLSAQDLADAQLQSPATAGAGNSSSAEMAQYIVASAAATAASYDIEKAAVEKIGVERLYPKLLKSGIFNWFGNPQEMAIDALDNDYDQKVEKNSNTIDLTYINDDPKVAQETLQTLVQLFLAKQSNVEKNPRSEVLKAQLATAQQEMSASQRRLLEFRRNVGVTDLNTERSLLLNQRDDIEENVNQAVATLDNAKALRDGLAAQLKALPKEIALANENDAVMRQLDSAKGKLDDAEKSLLLASQTYAAGSPLLEDQRASRDLAKQTYDALKKSSPDRLRTGPNSVYLTMQTTFAQTDADVQADQAVLDAWKGRLGGVEKRIDYLNQVEGDLLDLQNQLTVATTNYTSYLQRTEEARITEDLNRASSASLSVAQEPNLPYKPNRFTLIVLIGLGVGIFGGIGLCLGLEVFDETFGLPEHVKRSVGLPVLVSLNQASGKNGRRRGQAA